MKLAAFFFVVSLLPLNLYALKFTPHAVKTSQSSAERAASDAQSVNPLNVVGVRLQPSRLSPGQTADVLINMQLSEGFHAYADKFRIVVDSPDDLKIADVKLMPVERFYDAVTKKMRDGVSGSAKAQAVIEIPNGMKPGDVHALLRLTYQACTKAFCLFPKTVALEIPFTVIGDNNQPEVAAPKVSGPETSPTEQNSFQRAIGRSIFLAILVMFGLGLVTSLTPCIYPMIPITLAILGARTQGQTKLKSFSLSLAYVLGIALTYSVLGVVAAKTGALFGSALGNPYVVTAIALLFIAMALSMFGFYELQVPAFIRNSLGAKQSGSGYVGAFVTGLIAGVVASPCVGPVLVSVLTYIAETQNMVLGFVLLFSFALGLGVLFLVLGTFSSLISKMPKSGSWMNLTKPIFGLIMIAMAVYYVYPVYSRLLTHGQSPAAVAGAPADKVDHSNWQPYSDDALADALAAHKPVIVDFFAEWCGACKEMERETFPDERIQTLGKEFTLLRFDATDESPKLDELRKKYSIKGLPTMMFYDITGKLRTDLTVTGFEDAPTFIAQMTKAKNGN